MTQENAPEYLKRLIHSMILNEIDVRNFCEEYERVFNFEITKDQLSIKEQAIFESLFNRVVYNSPLSDEREIIQNYLGEKEILESANAAYLELNAGTQEAPGREGQR